MERMGLLRWVLMLSCLSLAESKRRTGVKVDLYVMGDTFTAGPLNFNKMLDFTARLTKEIHSVSDDVQVAVGVCEQNLHHLTDLSRYTKQVELAKEIFAQHHQGLPTEFSDPLLEVSYQGYLTSPLHGARVDAQKYLLVISDRQPQSLNGTVTEADNLRKQGITVLSIAVGVKNLVPYVAIVGGSDNLFSVASFDDLDTATPQIIQRICPVPVNS